MGRFVQLVFHVFRFLGFHVFMFSCFHVFRFSCFHVFMFLGFNCLSGVSSREIRHTFFVTSICYFCDRLVQLMRIKTGH
jgi:hypothetical protein